MKNNKGKIKFFKVRKRFIAFLMSLIILSVTNIPKTINATEIDTNVIDSVPTETSEISSNTETGNTHIDNETDTEINTPTTSEKDTETQTNPTEPKPVETELQTETVMETNTEAEQEAEKETEIETETETETKVTNFSLLNADKTLFNDDKLLIDNEKTFNVVCKGNNEINVDASIQNAYIDSLTLDGNTIINCLDSNLHINEIIWNRGTLTLNGNIIIEEAVLMSLSGGSSLVIEDKANVTIRNNLDMSLTRATLGVKTILDVKHGGTLNINGNLYGYKAGNDMQGYFYPEITMNGSVNISGNFDVNSEKVCMSDEEAYVKIDGFYKQQVGKFWGEYWSKDCFFTSGTLEVKGDYLFDSANTSGLSGNHLTIFSGTSLQSIYGIFKNVRVENTSSTGVVFSTIKNSAMWNESTLHTMIFGTLSVDKNSKISGSSTETILRNKVTALEIKAEPIKMQYLTSENFTGYGMELFVTYQNGQQDSTYGGWTSNYNFVLPYGEKEVSIEFGGKRISLMVELSEFITDPDNNEINIINLTPSNNAKNVDVNKGLKVEIIFDRPVILGEGSFFLIDGELDYKIKDIDINDSKKVKQSADGTKITINFEYVPYNHCLYILADKNIIVGKDGSKWAGLNDKTQWTFSTSHMKYELENIPPMTSQEAKEYLGFIFNDSECLDDDYILDNAYYKFLTGTYNGDDKAEVGLSLYNQIAASMNSHTNMANKFLESYREACIEFCEDLIKYIIDYDLQKFVLKDYLNKYYNDYITESLHWLPDADLVYDTVTELESQLDNIINGDALLPSKVSDVINLTVVATKTFFAPLESELKGRYEYFMFYNEMRQTYSPQDGYFQMQLGLKQFELQEEAGLLGAVMNCLPDKSSWLKNTDKIERWAEYTYYLQKVCGKKDLTSDFQDGDYTKIEIQCPVDVTVYSGNNIVAQIINNKINVSSKTDDLLVHVVNDAKILYIKSPNFRIEIMANEAGEMNYATQYINGNFEVVKQANYYNLPLSSGKLYQSSANGSSDDYMKLFETDGKNNNELVANDTGSSIEKYTISTKISEGGTIYGGGIYTKGTYAPLIAKAKTGYVFDGWYKNNQLLSSNSKYGITVLGNSTIEARFVTGKNTDDEINNKHNQESEKNSDENIAINNGYNNKIESEEFIKNNSLGETAIFEENNIDKIEAKNEPKNEAPLIVSNEENYNNSNVEVESNDNNESKETENSKEYIEESHIVEQGIVSDESESADNEKSKSNKVFYIFIVVISIVLFVLFLYKKKNK